MTFKRGHKRTRSKNGASHQSLYDTHEWRALRRAELKKHPYCLCPHCQGKSLRSQIVDHKKKHNGNRRLFFDPSNLMAMNKQCHDKFKQSQEAGGHGFMSGCNDSGEPLSNEHEWYCR